jgi:hypothetical protein
MTANIGTWAAAFGVGAAVGALYLGLLWAGARALAGRRPGLTFVALAITRAALVLAALAGGLTLGAGWAELAAGLAGFVVAKVVVTGSLDVPEGRREWK